MTQDVPDLLWIVWDACRADFTLTDFNGRPLTPNLSRLAKDAVTYRNAYTAAPWTPPSHASMFTGRYPSTHGYLDDGMDLDATHIAERLAPEGIQTVAVAPSPKIGSDTPLTNGFDSVYDLYRLPFLPMSYEKARRYYLDLWRAWIRFIPSHIFDHHETGYIGTRIVQEELENSPAGGSVFAFINYLSPHSRYHAPRPYRQRFQYLPATARPQVVEDLANRGGYRYIAGELQVRQPEWEALKSRYAAEIAYADSQLGHIIRYLKRRDMYEDTMMIVTADHGEHFGEHGLAYHQFSLYDELLHVPLMVKYPGNAWGGTEINGLVSLIDIYPTLLNIYQLDTTGSRGQDLRPGANPGHEHIFAEYGRPVTALKALRNNTDEPVDRNLIKDLDVALDCARSESTKVIRSSDGRREAYDLMEDPKESEDLSGDSDPPSSISKAVRAMSTNLSELPRVNTAEPEDTEVIDQLRELGYR